MTLEDLEQLIKAAEPRGVTVSFGQAVAASQRGRWFANTGPRTPQFYADTLEAAIRHALGATAEDAEQEFLV